MTIPDRSHILTEQRNPRTMNLHALSVAECVAAIQREDRAIPDAMERAAPALAAFIAAAEPGFRAGGRLIYFGAGTSGRLGVLDASEAPPTFQVSADRIIGFIAGGDGALRKSSEGKEDDPHGSVPQFEELKPTPRDAVVGIAAGGTTPYVLGGLEWAKKLGPNAAPITALLTCSPVPKPAFVDHLLVLETGPEVITGSTRMKAGTATKLALNTISTTLMVRSGRVFQNLMVDLRASNIKLRDRAARIISTITGLPREDSLALLDAAGGSVKPAVVMHIRKVTAAEAESMLAAAQGRLGDVIGDGLGK
jgi:N-acetylmuramic acid 6-phosphate etherase